MTIYGILFSTEVYNFLFFCICITFQNSEKQLSYVLDFLNSLKYFCPLLLNTVDLFKGIMIFLKLYVYMDMYVSTCVCVSTSGCRCQQDNKGRQTQASVSHLIGVLGTKLMLCVRVIPTLS